MLRQLAFAIALGATLAWSGLASATDDPWRYCRAVKTIDAVDARYVGEMVPARLVAAMRGTFGFGGEMPDEQVRAGTQWRCMGGAVWACYVGANLPCGATVDLRRVPSEGSLDWCRKEPEADSLPAVVTGRATAYTWRCRGGRPVVIRQVWRADARGFHVGIWRRVQAPAPGNVK